MRSDALTTLALSPLDPHSLLSTFGAKGSGVPGVDRHLTPKDDPRALPR
jgi:hypothetical protein